jgi:hypothetical protein
MYRRLIMGGALAVIGSWTLALSRLNLVRDILALSQSETASFFLDLAALTVTLFGILTAISVIPEFKERLSRIEALGENDW